jgi:GH15 family glucan-1,4-alpha-glucosidase
MPRDLPLGNGRLLVNFDKQYNLRDIYWPHVGQELHTAGEVSYTGVWVNGKFAWLDAPEWQREMAYDRETLVTQVTLEHPALQLKLVFNDIVDFNRTVFAAPGSNESGRCCTGGASLFPLRLAYLE